MHAMSEVMASVQVFFYMNLSITAKTFFILLRMKRGTKAHLIRRYVAEIAHGRAVLAGLGAGCRRSRSVSACMAGMAAWRTPGGRREV